MADITHKQTPQSLQLIRINHREGDACPGRACYFAYRIAISFILTNPRTIFSLSYHRVRPAKYIEPILRDCAIKGPAGIREGFYDPTLNTRSPETDQNCPLPPLLPLLPSLSPSRPSLRLGRLSAVDRLRFLQNEEAYEQVASITAACTPKLPRFFRPQAIIKVCSRSRDRPCKR